MTYSSMSDSPLQVLGAVQGGAVDEPVSMIPENVIGGDGWEEIDLTPFTITEPRPTGNRAIAIETNQPVRMTASASANWFQRTNGGAWSQIATAQTSVVWISSTSVTNRLTFDRVEIAIGSGASPSTQTTRHFDLCEGPVACLWASDRVGRDLGEPSLRPWEGEDDDPPLGTPLRMPAANRSAMGTVLCETVSEPGGPVNLVSSLGPGVFVDTAGKLGVRTPFTSDVRGLGPFPAIAAWYHGGLYFQHDYGKSRNLALTRVLYQDASSHVAVVRGDGRRNTYRWDGAAFVAAAGIRNTLTSSGGIFTETSPSGRVYRYDSNGRLQRVVDTRGTAAYYAYDANDRLQKIDGISGAGALGLVPYLSYDGNGLLTRLVLEDGAAAGNNRTTYFVYDADRNLQRIIGAEGCVTYFEYNHPLYLSAVTDSEGFRWYFGYDGNNRVTRVVDALGKAAYFAWDTSTPLSTHKDRAGKATYFRYNAFGAPDRVFNAGTPSDYYTWDKDGNLSRSKNRLGDEWVYEYDERANRTSVTDPMVGRTYFGYDGQDLLRVFTDPLYRSVQWSYDASRNRTAFVDQLGNAVYYEYESNGLLRQRKDRRGAFTYFVWDSKANVSKVNDALGQTTYFGYNSANERTAQVDPLGRISYFEFDKRGRLVKAINPIGAPSYMAYDGRCNLTSAKDALLRQVDHTYDGNSNRTLTLLPAVGGIRNPSYLTYDEEERVASAKNARGNATTWTYDALGRRQKQTDAVGGVVYFAYTDAHQLERQLDPLNNASYFRYDAVGRRTHVKDALLNETYLGYDLASQQVLVKDALARHTYFEYDPRGWRRQTKNAIGAISYVAFDEEGNRERAVDPRGLTAYFTYDLLGRMTHAKDQLLGVTYVGYDKASQSVLQLDQLGYPTYMTYDQAGRVQTTKDRAGLIGYMAYDLVNNLVASTFDDNGTRGTSYFAYDDLNRRTSSTDPLGNVSSVTYDLNGNVTAAINARGFATYFTYDALDRRTHVKDPVHFASTYLGFDAAGNVVRSIDQQGQTAYMTYDRLNRVSFQHDLASGLLSYMSFDAVGNRTEAHALLGAGGQRRSSYFQYDQANRRLKAIAPDTGATYFVFDLANNTTRVVDPMGRPAYMAYDELNRLKCRYNFRLELSYLHYDARSSVTKQIDGEGRTAYLGYDAAGRLANQGNALGEYSYFWYDARGNRTQVMNPRGYSTYFRFDLLARPSHRTHALGGVAYMGYDEVGNRVLNVDELGNPTYFTFDGLNRRTHVTDALLAISYMGFDNRSSLVMSIDAVGRTTYLGIDAAGRQDRRWFANPVAGESTDSPAYFVYNQASELTRCDDRLRSLDVSYFDRDVLGRVVKKATLSGAVYYAFDLSGLRTSLKDPGLAENVYVYDESARLSKQQLEAGRTIYYAYDRAGKLSKRLLPGGESGLPHRVMAYMFYDPAGRTQRIENRGSAYDTLINYFHYERNQNSFPTWIRREEDKNVYYQWDALDRLSMEQQITGITINFNDYYTWDLHGNKTSKLNTVSGQQIDSVYDRRNLLSKSHVVGGATIYFDFDASQRTQARRITDGTSSHYFTYDQLGRMQSVELLPPIGATDTFRLFHNAVGERVFKKDATTATPAYLAWDGKNVLMHRTGGGTVVIRYRFGRVPSAPIANLAEYDPVAFGTPKQLAAGDLSLRRLLQDAGAAFSYYNYDAFGATKTFVVGSGLTSNYHLRFRPDRKYNSVTLGDHVTGDADGSFESNEKVRGIYAANMARLVRQGFFGPNCGGMTLCGDNSSAMPLPVDDSGIAPVGRVPNVAPAASPAPADQGYVWWDIPTSFPQPGYGWGWLPDWEEWRFPVTQEVAGEYSRLQSRESELGRERQQMLRTGDYSRMDLIALEYDLGQARADLAAFRAKHIVEDPNFSHGMRECTGDLFLAGSAFQVGGKLTLSLAGSGLQWTGRRFFLAPLAGTPAAGQGGSYLYSFRAYLSSYLGPAEYGECADYALAVTRAFQGKAPVHSFSPGAKWSARSLGDELVEEGLASRAAVQHGLASSQFGTADVALTPQLARLQPGETAVVTIERVRFPGLEKLRLDDAASEAFDSHAFNVFVKPEVGPQIIDATTPTGASLIPREGQFWFTVIPTGKVNAGVALRYDF